MLVNVPSCMSVSISCWHFCCALISSARLFKKVCFFHSTSWIKPFKWTFWSESLKVWVECGACFWSAYSSWWPCSSSLCTLDCALSPCEKFLRQSLCFRKRGQNGGSVPLYWIKKHIGQSLKSCLVKYLQQATIIRNSSHAAFLSMCVSLYVG